MDEFQKLYNDNYKKVYFYLRSLCRNEKLAEDLCQDTFYKVLLHALDRPETVINCKWLMKIAHNVFIDSIRKNRLKFEDIDACEHEACVQPADSAGRLDMVNILELLPARYKSILLLRDHYGFSYEEIADIMKCSLDTVRVTLFRARRKFREVYEIYGYEGTE